MSPWVCLAALLAKEDMAAHHQHMRAFEQITGHVDPAFMLLGNGIIEEQGMEQRGADGRKARLIHAAAILRRLFCVFGIAAAPRSGDICEGSFHC